MASGDIRLIIDYQNGNIKAVSSESEKEFKKSGEKSGKAFGSSFNSTIKTSLKAVGALGAALGAIGTVTLFKSIEAAKVQEDAVNSLNTALKITGQFSEETSRELQAYASSLQEASKFGDEAILSAQGLLQSLGGLEKEGLKSATQATLDLAAALKIDLKSAATLVGKAAAGNVSSFSRYGVTIKTGKDATETFSNALTALQDKFGGAALGEINTYAGAVQQTSNSFGDFLEKIGDLVIKQPIIIKGIKALGSLFKELGEEVVAFGASFDIFEDAIFPLLEIGRTITEYVIPPLELLKNVGTVVFDTLVAGVSTVVAGFGFLGGKIAELLEKFNIAPELSQGLKDFAETSKQTAVEAATEVASSASSILDFPVSETLSQKNEDLKTYFQEQKVIIDEESAKSKESLITNQAQAVEATQTYSQLLLDTFANVEFGAKSSAEQMAKVAKQTANIVKGGLVKSISGGIQNIVTSLAKGEDVFANFGKFLLSTFGDLAIQLGNFWIAQGIAIEAANAVSGTGAIVAGAALVAVGSLLKAFAGGGGGGGGSGSAPSGATTTPSFITGDTVEEGFAGEGEPAQAGTIVNVNVDGNVNDGGAFIRDLAEQIGEESDKQGIVFNNLATV